MTSIGESAFENCSSLASINLPDNLTSIVSGAFIGCSSLASINLPDNLTRINSFTFYKCNSLASINLPDNLTSIGEIAFCDCSSLETVDASQCMNFEFIDDSAFDACPIKEFILGTSNPPSLSNIRPFDYMPDAVLKVPAGSIEAYKNSDWADCFGTIEAL